MVRKIFLLTFCGASPDFLFKYINEGELQNFKKIVEKGAVFKTIPVLNSVDTVTWTSALSGMNPGKLGVFDLFKPTKDYSPKFALFEEAEQKTLLTLLGEKMRAVVGPLNEIEERRNLGEGHFSEEGFLEALHHSEEEIVNRAKSLMKEDWRFFIVQFHAIDKAQHIFYRCIDERHPAYTGEDARKYRNAILKAYKVADEYLGILADELEKMGDIALFVFSDKGIAPVYKHVHINNYLAEKGVIVLKGNGKAFTDVDWDQTLAYQVGFGQIRVNLKGRESKGIVEQGREYEDVRRALVKLLENMKDPKTGEKIIEKVFRKEELYWGQYLENGPDLLVSFKRGYATSQEDATGIFGGGVVKENRGKWSGDHVGVPPSAIPGFLIAQGDGIKGGDFGTTSILDLAPTILYYLGSPIPKNMDGKVLEPMFEEDFLKKNPAIYKEVKQERRVVEKRGERVLSEEDEEKIKERLRGLGYMA